MVRKTRSSSAAAAAATGRSMGKGKENERLPEEGRDGGRKEKQKQKQKGSEQRKEKQKQQAGTTGKEGTDDNQFFKVFFPEQSGERLTIPPTFQEYLQEPPNTPRLLSLKGPSGNTWELELVLDAQGLSFTKGWKKFARDHSLVSGQFMVFTYDGHSQFSVVVFSLAGVRDRSARAVQPSEDRVVKLEDEEGVADDHVASRSEESVPLVERSRRTSRNRVTQENATVAATLEASARHVEPSGRSRRRGARQANVSGEPNGNVSVADTLEVSAPPMATSGRSTLKRARQANDVAENVTTPKRKSMAPKKPQQSSLSLLARHTCCDKTMFRPMDVTRIGTFASKKFRQPVLISQRRPVTEEEKNHAFERAKEFKSQNPFSVQVMMDSYVYVGFFMNIPCEFVRESLPQESKTMTLWDPQGKSWDVKYVYCNDRGVGAFSGGWGKFALGNNLEKFDVCVFELFKEDNIKVHIYRVIPEITPLVRKQHVTRCRSNFGECNSIFQKLGKN